MDAGAHGEQVLSVTGPPPADRAEGASNAAHLKEAPVALLEAASAGDAMGVEKARRSQLPTAASHADALFAAPHLASPTHASGPYADSSPESPAHDAGGLYSIAEQESLPPTHRVPAGFRGPLPHERDALDIAPAPGWVAVSGDDGASLGHVVNFPMNKNGWRYVAAGPAADWLPRTVYRALDIAPEGIHWSWQDRSPFTRISRDALLVGTDKGYRSARTNVGVREGAWYVEMEVLPPDTSTRASPPMRDGPHVRLGWGRREAALNAPVGWDAYSYGFRDQTGARVTLSTPEVYGRPFGPGDVVGLYIRLPTDGAPSPGSEHRIQQKHVPIRYKGQLYFESLEYPTAKEMDALMDQRRRGERTWTATDTLAPALERDEKRPARVARSGASAPGHVESLCTLPTLPGSCIGFVVNGEPQGIAFSDLYDFRPLRTEPGTTTKGKRERGGADVTPYSNASAIVRSRLNTFDDGDLGYYPMASMYGGARMMFLGASGKVYILDKVENNPLRINGHPAWGVEYDYNSNKHRAMDVRTNTFCAGGASLGDGRYIVTGGNKAVGPAGVDAKPGADPYDSYNGGRALRFLSPCKDESCDWQDKSSTQLNKERWYPTVEPLADGHVVILGGMRDGGYVPSHSTNEPSYEFYPPKGNGESRHMDFLDRTVPLSLYPHTFLLSNGELFMQAARETILWNYKKRSETRLPNIPSAPRVYPANGGAVLLPLTPKNNYEETVLFCAGTSLGNLNNWGDEGGPAVMVTEHRATQSCDQIKPLSNNPSWETVDDVPQPRSMGQFNVLPNGKLWFGNGVATGTAGYTNNPHQAGKPVGHSFSDNPVLEQYLYDPEAPAGKRWEHVGTARVGRLYHSSAILLPDSSILIAGSNPNMDYTKDAKFNTEYRVERWYPDYYNKDRPSSRGLPSSFKYGGKGFSIKLDSAQDAKNAKVVLIRTGFSTHAMVMGQRYLELRSKAQGSTLHVAQLPSNPNLFAPGPALAFVVVDGVPSHGKFVTVGNGQISSQPTHDETDL
ncbi:(methyl)glyoxal oxidase [Malassezia sp. CBS 17886]|nr:(methyl)glyoxal oxidase [Malassezia sp. CBS 17886]